MREWSIAGRFLALQAVVVGLLVAGGTVVGYLDAADDAEDSARRAVVSVAITVADSPALASALAEPSPTDKLQPFAERVRTDTDTDFVTIMNTSGVRFTHPNPARIGERFLGNTAEALAGRTFTETYTGTLGPSIRAVAPVFGPDRSVIALVSVGITLSAIAEELRGQVVMLLLVALGALAVGALGAYLVSTRLRKLTRGVGPARLTRMIDYHEAILHSVREGLVLLDKDGTVTLCNGGARELLDLPADAEGRKLTDLGLSKSFVDSMLGDGPVHDEIFLTERRVVLANKSTVQADDGSGSVITARDHTELQALSGELDSVKGFAESLRSQAHEAANRLHTVVSLIELDRPDDAVRFATDELRSAQELTDRVVGAVAEPVLAALLLGKAAQASERGVELVITDDTELDELDAGISARDLVTILGNLIDNSIDAAADPDSLSGESVVSVTVRTEPGVLLLRVADTGPGLDPDAAGSAFRRGWSTKGGGRGLGLALVGQTVRRYGGTVEVDGAVFTVRLPS